MFSGHWIHACHPPGSCLYRHCLLFQPCPFNLLLSCPVSRLPLPWILLPPLLFCLHLVLLPLSLGVYVVADMTLPFLMPLLPFSSPPPPATCPTTAPNLSPYTAYRSYYTTLVKTQVCSGWFCCLSQFLFCKAFRRYSRFAVQRTIAGGVHRLLHLLQPTRA